MMATKLKICDMETKGNFTTAVLTLEEALEDIKRCPKINRVFIRVICANGGVTNVNAVLVKNSICSYEKSDKTSDDPDLARIGFRKVLQMVATDRHNGSIVFEINCKDSRVFNANVTATEHTNLFRSDFCGELGAKWGGGV
jgi:hypothetical protein